MRLLFLRPLRPIRMAAVLVPALLALAAGHADAERFKQAPASRVALELPDGFEAASLFSGFTHEGHGISVVVVELPAEAYASIATGLTPQALASKGVLKAAPAKLERNGPHVYMRGEQASAAGEFAKFFVLFREGDVTALVTANVPKATLERRLVADTMIERMLASARVAAMPAPARELFRLGYLGPFKPAGSFLGAARTYTLDGAAVPTPPSSGKPLLVVAPSLDRRTVEKPDVLAERLLAGLDVTDLRVLGRNAVTYGGLSGVEIEARALDRTTGAELMLYQVLLIPRDGGYFRILGQAPLAGRDRYLPEMRRIAESFTLTP